MMPMYRMLQKRALHEIREFIIEKEVLYEKEFSGLQIKDRR